MLPDRLGPAQMDIEHAAELRIAELCRRNGATKPKQSPVDLVRLSTVEPRPVEWLWRNRIPLGTLSVIAGDPSAGKSTLTLDLAARVSTGRPWPDSRDEPNRAGDVVIISGEDGVSDTIRPRIDAACGDPSRVFVLNGVRHPESDYVDAIQLDRDLRHLASVVRERPSTRLVVLDPLDGFLGESCDSHRKSDVQRVLGGLTGLSEDHGVAVLGVLHLRKSSGDKGLYRVLGSLGFVSAPRAVWAVSRDREDPKRRILTCVKMNLAPDPTGLAFSIEDAGGVGVVHWRDGDVTTSADEALEYDRPKTRTVKDDAVGWLVEMLAVGPVGSDRIKREGDEAGFSWATLRRAKDEIGVRARRGATGWTWELPKALTSIE